MIGKLKEKIAKAAIKSGRDPSEIKIIGASKLQSAEHLSRFSSEVYAYAENYVQEFLEKKSKLPNVKWHFIGPLQTNKIKKIVGQVELIHSVGRLEEAEEISKKSLEKNIVQKCLIEINIAEEPSKHGINPGQFPGFLEKTRFLKGIEVVGIMVMPPLNDNPENSRKYFKKAFDLAKKYNLQELSMGTSSDFEIAIEEGATMIRLGEILFGARPKREK